MGKSSRPLATLEASAAGPVPIVSDEFPAMEILAAKLKALFRAMAVYIHGDIQGPRREDLHQLRAEWRAIDFVASLDQFRQAPQSEATEVYLNHVFLERHQILLSLKYTDEKSGKTYMQDRAG